MFKYNVLSDLLTGELVTPLRLDQTSGKVICLNSTNQEVLYSFSEFDFTKTVEERAATTTTIDDIAEAMSSDIEPVKVDFVPYGINAVVGIAKASMKAYMDAATTASKKKVLLKSLGYTADDPSKVNIEELFTLSVVGE